MNEEQFLSQAQAFLSKLKASALYQRKKKLSQELTDDEEVKRLAKERDDAFLLSTESPDKEEASQAARLAHEKQEELYKLPLVKEYLSAYSDLKEILSLLNFAFYTEVQA